MGPVKGIPKREMDSCRLHVLSFSSVDHPRRRFRLLGENRYPVSPAISGGEANQGNVSPVSGAGAGTGNPKHEISLYG